MSDVYLFDRSGSRIAEVFDWSFGPDGRYDVSEYSPTGDAKTFGNVKTDGTVCEGIDPIAVGKVRNDGSVVTVDTSHWDGYSFKYYGGGKELGSTDSSGVIRDRSGTEVGHVSAAPSGMDRSKWRTMANAAGAVYLLVIQQNR